MAIPAQPKRWLEVVLKTGEIKVFPMFTDDFTNNEHWDVIREEVGMSNWTSYQVHRVPPFMPIAERKGKVKAKFLVIRTRLDGDFKSDIIRFQANEEELGGFLRRSNSAFRDKGMNILFTYKKIGEPDVRIIDFNGYLRTLN